MIDSPIPNPPTAADGAFLALGLAPALVAAVASLGYEEPTDIQREAKKLQSMAEDIFKRHRIVSRPA